MNLKTTLAAAAGSTLFLSSLALTQAHTDHEAIKGEILALIAPPSLSSAPSSAPTSEPKGTQEDFKLAVGQLVQSGNEAALSRLGESAAPALLDLAHNAHITTLASGGRSPLPYLTNVAPDATFQFYESVFESSIARFEAIAFAPGGLFEIEERFSNPEIQNQRYPRLVERVVANERLPLSFKVQLAAKSLAEGRANEKVKTFLIGNVSEWTTELSANDALGELYVSRVGLPPADLGNEAAMVVMQGAPTLEVAVALSASTHPKVRKTAIMLVGSSARSAGTRPACESLVKIIAGRRPGDVGSIRSAMRNLKPGDGATFTLSELNVILPVFDEIQAWEGGSYAGELLGIMIPYALQSAGEEDVAVATELIERSLDPKLGQVLGHLFRHDRRIKFPTVAGFAAFKGAFQSPYVDRAQGVELLRRTTDRMEPAQKAETYLSVLADEALGPYLALEHGFRNEVLEGVAPRQVGQALQALAQFNIPDQAWSFLKTVQVQVEALHDTLRSAESRDRTRFLATLGLISQHSITSDELAIGAQATARLLENEGDQRWVIEVLKLARATHSVGNPLVSNTLWSDFALETTLRFVPRGEIGDLLAINYGEENKPESFWAKAIERAAALQSDADCNTWLERNGELLLEGMLRFPKTTDLELAHAVLARSIDIELPVSVVLESGDQASEDRFRRTLLDLVRRSNGGRSLTHHAHQLLRFDLESTVPLLAQVAAERGDRNLVLAVTGQLKDLTYLRDASTSFTSGRSGIGSREDAIAEVLTLLDDVDPEVRKEAIRGLGTLSAVEALPRLIRIVGSGTADEKAAARETLGHLNRVVLGAAAAPTVNAPAGK